MIQKTIKTETGLEFWIDSKSGALVVNVDGTAHEIGMQDGIELTKELRILQIDQADRMEAEQEGFWSRAWRNLRGGK